MPASERLPPTRHGRARNFMRVGKRLSAFRRDQEGVAAVEFALIAVPFFALLFGILETALVFWSTQVLETAVSNAARTIYTGQFQSANTSGDIGKAFKTEVCKHVSTLFECNEDAATVHVDVRIVTPTIEPAIKDGLINPAAFGYQRTGANDIVLVRVAVELPIFVSLLNPNQANLTNGNRLIMSSATFRNEPF